MTPPISRRSALKAAAVVGCLATLPEPPAEALGPGRPGVHGPMSGARALVEALLVEGTTCVFGIPGAQENELWDEMKSRHLPYLLVTNEFSASCMADGYARSTGRPGVLSVVPGPGLTNAISGIGEALLDSVPMVCIVGDVARGDKYRPFQVHELNQVGLLQQVTKAVIVVQHPAEIPLAVWRAFRLATCEEPGPVGVVVPYNYLLVEHRYHCFPLGPNPVPFDENAFQCALGLLANRRLRVGIYAGQGCMDHSAALTQLAEVLQAPVATSVSGKGAINECHPLAAGWGYGPQGTQAAEMAFKCVDLVLAIGVRYSEVSTGFYAIPKTRYQIHVDINAANLGRIVKADVCVHSDAGVFLNQLLQHSEKICRPPDNAVVARIQHGRAVQAKESAPNYGQCGIDPVHFLRCLRAVSSPDALVYVDVTLSEHWAAEMFQVTQPRTYFNPTDNQGMGWSIPASLGGQRAFPGRQTFAILGDGCFLMSAMEISTAAREGLPVKFFILDDQAYHFMQALQLQAYRRTTATVLARLDYAALAKGFGVGYQEISPQHDLEASLRNALACPGPVLVRVVTDYGKRPCRWVEATKDRFIEELSAEQKARFAARIGSRALHPRQQQND